MILGKSPLSRQGSTPSCLANVPALFDSLHEFIIHVNVCVVAIVVAATVSSMGKYAQLVIGPAGSGKSTYCDHLYQHCQAIRRSLMLVNLDPAAEQFSYPVYFDVRELVTLEDVMQEANLGPNGGLLYCMEYLEDNLHDWLGECLESCGEEDYLVFDCPGQIELYSQASVFQALTQYLRQDGWSVCVVYCLDSHFMTEPTKFIAGALQVLSSMVQMELPQVNVLTKVDICENKEELQELLIPSAADLAASVADNMPPRFRRMSSVIATLLDEFSLVSFVPLDITDEDSIAEVLGHIDMAIQHGEDAEPRIREEFDDEEDGAVDPP